MKNITFLGPAGATFSAIAYEKLARIYGAPTTEGVDGIQLSLANTNEDVLPLILGHGGYGAIAMETKAEGRVDSPVNSFIKLLRDCDENCSVQIIGALCMNIRFALMAQKGITLAEIDSVIAHPKALGACRNHLLQKGFKLIESSSNGKAAEDVSSMKFPANVAALAPIEAAEKYGLNVLIDGFEDKPAVTTFFLLGPRGVKTSIITSVKRSLIVFRVKHEPLALVKVLTPFGKKGINLRLVHSLYLADGVYDFAIETESNIIQTPVYNEAFDEAVKYMDRYIHFGPFPVVVES